MLVLAPGTTGTRFVAPGLAALAHEGYRRWQLGFGGSFPRAAPCLGTTRIGMLVAVAGGLGAALRFDAFHVVLRLDLCLGEKSRDLQLVAIQHVGEHGECFGLVGPLGILLGVTS